MKRLVMAAVSASLLLGALAPGALAADPDRAYRRADLEKIDRSFRPYLADTARRVTVVLELAGDPAVATEGSRSERKTRAADLDRTQKKLDAGIKSAGGRVLGRYQFAYNGIKVRATGAQLTELASLPGVVAVRRLATYRPTNANALPYIGAPAAWHGSGTTGAGQTIAVIDSGIDYTHADFGGPGTPEAYAANDPTIIESGTFPTAKVIGGHDFAGDDYDASGEVGSTTPVPDADPLDCGDHGTHVAGSAAGQGVLADQTTYPGPYDADTLEDPSAFIVAPGVAPQANLIALKVFGCDGSTDLVVDALEWVAAYNVANVDGIDIVNMSLGADFGANDEPDAIATNNLVDSGVVVVASAGNGGNVPFITGAPAAATKAISVANLDAFPALPMALVDLPSGSDIPGINQNAFPSLPVTGTLHVVPAAGGGVSLGCEAADFDAASAGKIVAVKRGVCPFVDKGAAAQDAGAIGVIMINRDDTEPGDLPTFLGYNPELYEIPMVGVDRLAQPVLQAAEGATITLRANGTSPNPEYQRITGGSSAGPRMVDNWLKPDVAAPGVNITSALSGSGWNGTTYSGTSMAAPMTAGTAALVLQAHPGWSPLKVKAAIANTASADDDTIIDYDPLLAGSGVVDARRAVATKGLATTSDRTASLSFGYEPSNGRFSETKSIRLWNTGSQDVWYTLEASSPLVTITPSKVKVRARSSAEVRVRASLSRAQVAELPTADQFVSGAFGTLDSLSGVVVATPKVSGPGYGPLRVPYLLVPRGLSDVDARLKNAGHGDDYHVSGWGGGGSTGGIRSQDLVLRNSGIREGYAGVYALALTDRRGDGPRGTDLRAVGVQAFDAAVLTGVDDPSDRGIQFAINVWDRFTTAAPIEIDIAVDNDGDGIEDVYVLGIDDGLFFAGAFDGLYLSLVLDAETFEPIGAWFAAAPPNGSTLILPALASELGLSEGDGSFSYRVLGYDAITGLVDEFKRTATFDPFDPQQSSGDFVAVEPGAKVTIPVWSRTSKDSDAGWMVVTLDDRNGAAQADIVRSSGKR